jgi:hypothetical protein
MGSPPGRRAVGAVDTAPREQGAPSDPAALIAYHSLFILASSVTFLFIRRNYDTSGLADHNHGDIGGVGAAGSLCRPVGHA